MYLSIDLSAADHARVLAVPEPKREGGYCRLRYRCLELLDRNLDSFNKRISSKNPD